ncbi:MAG TPA: PEP-CTERM sorting domain-containing protein [Acetobacteraceae bacterium]|jgi:hypothetical protein
MRQVGNHSWIRAAILAAVTLVSAATAKANIISSSPSLPIIGVPFIASAGLGCLPAANVCFLPGSLTFGSTVSSGFNIDGQDIVSNLTYMGELTSAVGGNDLGPISLTGTIEQEILGRTTSTQTGLWTIDVLGLSLSGPLQANTLSLNLSSAHASVGSVSITPVTGGNYNIGSSLDLVVDLFLDSNPPLSVQGIAADFTLQDTSSNAVPEPSTLAILIVALASTALLRKGSGNL